MQTIKIPVVIDKTRLRGNSVGTMVDDDYGENNLDVLRNLLKAEAVIAGVEPTQEWVTTCVSQLLRGYEQAHADWKTRKDDTIGFVHELAMPSGDAVLMGDRRTLARLKSGTKDDLFCPEEEESGSRPRMR